jgi:hypothetical protein
MQNRRIFFLVLIISFAFLFKVDCQKQIIEGFSPIYKQVSLKIESAAYRDAFRQVIVFRPRSISEQCEKDVLLGRIYFAQGAFYLAEDRLNNALKYAKDCRPELVEKAYLMRGDIYYQMLEFDRNYNNSLELGRFWQNHFPQDEQRKSILHTIKAQYFAALIKADSAKFHTIRALELHRKNRVNKSELPLWMIYANHVACLRNGLSVSSDMGEEKKIAYADTCRKMLNQWFTNSNVEKLRVIQSLSMIVYDRLGAYANWTMFPEKTRSSFKQYLSLTAELSAQYEKYAGPRHPYNAQVQFLVGLVYHYKKDSLPELHAYSKSLTNNFSSERTDIPFILNWRRYFSTFRFYPFLKSKLYFPKNQLTQLQFARRCLESSEELFYLRYFYNAILLDRPEDDVYLANPFLDIEDTNIDLFELTGNLHYRNEAWAASQKGKYTDLLRQRYRELNFAPGIEFLEKCNRNIGSMRLLNDTILLCSHQFEGFNKLSIDKLERRLSDAYANFKADIRLENLGDPLAGKFLNGREVFTINAVQKSLKGKNAAWVDISHGGRTGQFYTMIWYITADTAWVKVIKDHDIRKAYLTTLTESLQKNSIREWKICSHGAYFNVFKYDFDILRSKHVTRIYYSPGQSYSSFSPEMLVTDTVSGGRPRFLAEYFAFSTQLIAPTEFTKADTPVRVASGDLTCIFAPILHPQLLDLNHSRKIASELAAKFPMRLYAKFCTAEDFLEALKSAQTVQIFSHGEGEKGIWLSDRLITPSEVRSLHLAAELVSLTTCESYNGELVHNEGVRGMVEAFSRAGAKRILASLWKIDERSSAQIIANFFSNLYRGEDPDFALQHAKVQFLNTAHPEELHPFFWAGIELFGKPTRYQFPQHDFKIVMVSILASIATFALAMGLVFRFRF